MSKLGIGQELKFHPNVNKDPYLGNCVLCGRKVGNSPKLIRFDMSARIDPSASDRDSFLFAVGVECAQKFEPEVFVQ